jgi:hypothetical protein
MGMMRGPIRHFASAFVVIALAFAAARTVGSAAAPQAEAEAPLTKEQWAKLVKRMDENGQTRDLPFKVAEHLGLTKGAEVMKVHELAFEREGYQHGIYRSIDPKDDRIILAFRTPEKRWTAFLADSRFQLVLAVVWNAGDTPEPWPNDQALPAFRNELGYWSVIADLL